MEEQAEGRCGGIGILKSVGKTAYPWGKRQRGAARKERRAGRRVNSRRPQLRNRSGWAEAPRTSIASVIAVDRDK